jgi:hypothetical protein
MIGTVVVDYSPWRVTALIWTLGVLCGLPFKRFRAVVPLALLTWGAGSIAAIILSVMVAGIVGWSLLK